MDRMPDVTFATVEPSDDEGCTDEESEDDDEEDNMTTDPTADEYKMVASRARHCIGSCSSRSSQSEEDEEEADDAVADNDDGSGINARSRSASRAAASSRAADGAAFENVYEELHDISARLKTENRLLHDRELRLKTREEEIERAYRKLARVIHRSADEKCSQVEMQAKEKVAILSRQLKDKCKENKRLRGNFEALRSANDELKKQLEALQSQHDILEKQATSLKLRLENLQRVQQFKDKQTEDVLSELKPKLDVKNSFLGAQRKKKLARTSAEAPAPSLYDALSLSLEWIVRDVLAPSCSRSAVLDATLRFRLVDSAQQLTPLIVRRLRDNAELAAARLGLPSLQFIYWGCLLADRGETKQNTAFIATMRHLCEELYRPLLPLSDGADRASTATDGQQALSSNACGSGTVRPRLVFVKSPDLHVRLLSCLLLLKNLSQADLIANAFDLLKAELKEERSKELFVYYQGTSVIMQYFKPTTKVHLPAVLDVYMLLTVESTVTPAFLESCSCEAWFRCCAMVLKIPNLDERLLEKLSVILQKLSKIRSNRKHFDLFQLKPEVQEIMRMVSSDSSSFTVLNCKSILFNLA